ncbi:MAG TPA: response regulator, partial [Acidimicrobiales bacterium]|nr:response regulator [Acidimicrobiales bacterium]
MPANILLVEDEPNVAFVVSSALKLSNDWVMEARSGEEGLSLARQLPLDLAIFDVMLPDLDGFEICQRLRSEGFEFPIIFLTARDAAEDRIRGLTIG